VSFRNLRDANGAQSSVLTELLRPSSEDRGRRSIEPSENAELYPDTSTIGLGDQIGFRHPTELGGDVGTERSVGADLCQ
jgi:hypothetical protein